MRDPDRPQPPSSQPALDAALAGLSASFDDRFAPSSQPSLDGAIAALPASFDDHAGHNIFSSSYTSVYAPAALPLTTPALAAPPVPGLTPSQQAALDSVFASQGVASFTPQMSQDLPAPPPIAAPAFGDPLSFDAIVSAPPVIPAPPIDTNLITLSPRSPASSIGVSDPNWAKRPDREPTSQEVALVLHDIRHGVTRTIQDFTEGAPAVPHSPNRLEEVLEEPSTPADIRSAVEFENFEDEEDESPINWPSSQEENLQLAKLVATLSEAVPWIQEDMVVEAVTLHKGQYDQALLWLQDIHRGHGDRATLSHAFPSAPPRELSTALKKAHASGFGFRGAYYALLKSYTSSWTPTLAGPNPTPSALGDMETDDKEYFGIDADYQGFSQSHSSYEANWWTSTSASRAHLLGADSPYAELWTAVSRVCMGRHNLFPRTLGRIRTLGSRFTDKRNFYLSYNWLSSLPSYRRVRDYVLEHSNEPAVAEIIRAHLVAGIASPGAIAWLANYASDDRDAFSHYMGSLGMFEPKFHVVWKMRNQALHQWRQIQILAKKTPSRTSGQPSRAATIVIEDSDDGAAIGSRAGPAESSIGASRTSKAPASIRTATSRPYPLRADQLSPVTESPTKEKKRVPLAQFIRDIADPDSDAPVPAGQVTLDGRYPTRPSLLTSKGKMTRKKKVTADREVLQGAITANRLRRKAGGKGRQTSPIDLDSQPSQ